LRRRPSLAELGGGQARDHLELRQVFQQVGVRGQEADTDVGRDGLRVAADVDHPRELVQAGQAGAGLGVELDVDVVLDDGEVVLLGDLQQPVQLRHRRHRPGGALQSGLGEEDLGAMLRNQRLQRGQVVALGGARHAEQPGTLESQ
jgi:hypothetical protein